MYATWTKPEIIKLVKELVPQCTSYRQVLTCLGVTLSGSNAAGLKNLCRAEKVDVSHFLGQGSQKGKTGRSIRTPLPSLLVENSYLNATHVKPRLFEAGLLKNQCSVCNIGPFWAGQPLQLQLDHINGVHTDNRLLNLRILCPNCHAQTPTFGRRNRKLNATPTPPRTCLCGRIISRKARTCKACRLVAPKISWPSDEELIEMLKNRTYTSVAKDLGVSDNAIRKRLKLPVVVNHSVGVTGIEPV